MQRYQVGKDGEGAPVKRKVAVLDHGVGVSVVQHSEQACVIGAARLQPCSASEAMAASSRLKVDSTRATVAMSPAENCPSGSALECGRRASSALLECRNAAVMARTPCTEERERFMNDLWNWSATAVKSAVLANPLPPF
jgi:hypothetical protein